MICILLMVPPNLLPYVAHLLCLIVGFTAAGPSMDAKYMPAQEIMSHMLRDLSKHFLFGIEVPAIVKTGEGSLPYALEQLFS